MGDLWYSLEEEMLDHTLVRDSVFYTACERDTQSA